MSTAQTSTPSSPLFEYPLSEDEFYALQDLEGQVKFTINLLGHVTQDQLSMSVRELTCMLEPIEKTVIRVLESADTRRVEHDKARKAAEAEQRSKLVVNRLTPEVLIAIIAATSGAVCKAEVDLAGLLAPLAYTYNDDEYPVVQNAVREAIERQAARHQPKATPKPVATRKRAKLTATARVA